MNKKINIMYFSATDTTKKVVCGIAKKISESIDREMNINNIDFTLPVVREKIVSFTAARCRYYRSSSLCRKSS